MSKKNISLILSSLALLSTAGLQADEALDYSTLGTGEEIRADILPVADEDDADDDSDRQETDAQRKARLKREAEQRKKRNGRNGNKSTQEKCGEGTCS